MPHAKTIGVLTSGGIDSAVLLAESLKTGNLVTPIYIRCGLRWERAELHWLRRYLAALRRRRQNMSPLAILSVPVKGLYGAHWSLTGKKVPGYSSRDERVYLPGRNLLLLSHAAVFCAQRKIPVLRLGTLKGNPFPDSTPVFFRAMEKTIREAVHYNISIQTPFRRRTKAEILRLGEDLPLRFAFSCLSPRGMRACGRCNKCAELKRARSQ